MHLRLRTTSPEATESLGATIASVLGQSWVIALDGELGSGKTKFVHGLAVGLGVDCSAVASPTYVICTRHDGEASSLAHIDAYRIENENELETIGFDEMLAEQSLGVAIEWASRIDGALPQERIEVRLAHRGEKERAVEIFDRRDNAAQRQRLQESLAMLFGAVEVVDTEARCPSCLDAKPTAAQTPFCSTRCRLVDLGNWLGGNYLFSRPMHADEELGD